MFFFSQIWPKKSPKKSRREAPEFFLDFFLDKNFGSEGKRDFGLFFGQKTEKNGPEGPDFWEISFFWTFFWTRKKKLENRLFFGHLANP